MFSEIVLGRILHRLVVSLDAVSRSDALRESVTQPQTNGCGAGWMTDDGTTWYWIGTLSHSVSVGCCVHVFTHIKLALWDVHSHRLQLLLCGVQTADKTGRLTGKKKKLTKDRKSSTKLRAPGVFSGCWTLSLICRLQRFTQALPKRSKCFRSDGCEAGLHPNTSWRQRLLRYWLPFSSCLQERGSNARRRNNNKVHGALLRTPLLTETTREWIWEKWLWRRL